MTTGDEYIPDPEDLEFMLNPDGTPDEPGQMREQMGALAYEQMVKSNAEIAAANAAHLHAEAFVLRAYAGLRGAQTLFISVCAVLLSITSVLAAIKYLL